MRTVLQVRRLQVRAQAQRAVMMSRNERGKALLLTSTAGEDEEGGCALLLKWLLRVSRMYVFQLLLQSVARPMSACFSV